MAMNEGDTREDVYERWRKEIIELDGTRLFIPSGSFPDYRENVPEWIKKDTPVGMNDYSPKSYGWQKPSTYYKWVREERNWMFMIESGSASLPPIASLKKFIPNLGETSEGVPYPLNETWAHHGANSYYKNYDSAVRRIYGPPDSVEDYCLKGHLVTADQHRAMFEAANHRMWDITSGFTQWKVNACWPSVQWQIYDWYLKPMVSYYYIKSACEPLHIQLSPIDSCVIIVNNYLESKENLEVRAKVYDFNMKLRWEDSTKVDIEANKYKDVFIIPDLAALTSIYFVKLELRDGDNNLVSSNFYWLPSEESNGDTGCFIELGKLPLVRLDASYEIESKGGDGIARVKVENPTDELAFFIHLAVTKGLYGEEVLPVFWDDNYFSLLPGEKKEVSATFALGSLEGVNPVVEVGGWNIQSGFECIDLELSKTEVTSNEPFTVTATIENTFIDGSKIELYVNNKVVDSKLFWARGESGKIGFTLKLCESGLHEIRVGNLTTSVLVN
jgi:exo-1,4-beta-D-glucosaminidase